MDYPRPVDLDGFGYWLCIGLEVLAYGVLEVQFVHLRQGESGVGLVIFPHRDSDRRLVKSPVIQDFCTSGAVGRAVLGKAGGGLGEVLAVVEADEQNAESTDPGDRVDFE